MGRVSAVLLSLAISLVAAPKCHASMEQKCLDCICKASSNCDEKEYCHTSGGNYYCGPYLISWAYWHDSGRPGDKGGAHDWSNCLTNKQCADQSVRGYMRRYRRDCDGDGLINCNDYARIHKLGFTSCYGNAVYGTEYWKKFETCYYDNTDAVQPIEYDNTDFVQPIEDDDTDGVQPIEDFEENRVGRITDYGEGRIEERKAIIPE